MSSNKSRPSTARPPNTVQTDNDFIDNLGVLQPIAPRRSNSSISIRREFIGGNHPNSVLTQEGLTIVLAQGSIVEQTVDAVVNSIGGHFSLSEGVLAKLILQHAGDYIQKELTANKPNDYKYGEVVVTKGYRLSCRYVFHGVLLPYSNKTAALDPETILRNFVRNVLQKTNDLKLGSVAIPAIGTGALGFPSSKVVECLFKEADKFSSDNPKTHINEIRFIVYIQDKETFNAFDKMMSEIRKKQGCPEEIDDEIDDLITNIKLKDVEIQVKKDSAAATPKFKQLGVEFPENWESADSDLLFERVELKSSDSEFKSVTQQVLATMGNSCSQILKIERIENRSQWLLYMVNKHNITTSNPANTENERSLWHGTSVDGLDNICAGGFNRSYCGKNATFFGEGVYFAKEFAYSAQAIYSRPDTDGTKYIFLCKVLTGTFNVGKPTMKEPEIRTGKFRHNSVVNDLNNPVIFVVFRDAQAYPEYLISFVN